MFLFSWLGIQYYTPTVALNCFNQDRVNLLGNKVSRGQLKHKPMTVQGSAVRVVGLVLVFINEPLGLLETTWPQQ